MMCLGWSTKPTCAARPTMQAGGQAAAAQCPDITWFWASALAIVTLGLFGGGGGK